MRNDLPQFVPGMQGWQKRPMYYMHLKMKVQKSWIISTNEEKAFEKKFKAFQPTRNRRKSPQHNKIHLLKIHNKCHTQWQKTEHFPSEIQK
jgi:hypothetical protein